MPLKKSEVSNITHRCRIQVIDLEPTPYKTDLWNAFSEPKEIELFVLYTEQKNWAPDGGHNYLKWPTYRHNFSVLSGKGIVGRLQSAIIVAQHIFKNQADLTIIAGYDRLTTVTAIFCSTLKRRRFVVHADEFNNQWPSGKLAWLKLPVRELLRKITFKQGDAVLVCGKRGIESAIEAGCVKDKILNFPYVIDAQRMKNDSPTETPVACRQDMSDGKVILFFSGRMIPRKGLPTLLTALVNLTIKHNWVLWIEGDGPELPQYQQLAKQLDLEDRCRFLGFCQYDVHSWLIRSSDIVVVPSLEDSWGIVVDEGLQMGKAVISSDATGSGYDRIDDCRNGYLFPAGDTEALSNHLELLINNETLRSQLGVAAAASPSNLRPQDHLETLLTRIRKVS